MEKPCMSSDELLVEVEREARARLHHFENHHGPGHWLRELMAEAFAAVRERRRLRSVERDEGELSGDGTR